MKLNQSFKFHTIHWLVIMCSFIYLTVFYVPSSTSACSCAQPPSVDSELSQSDVVFSGKVISVKENGGLTGPITKEVIFEVSQTWKEVKESQIKITTGQGGGDCGIPFKLNEEYLVYGRYSDMYGKNQLITGICDRTTELSLASEDLQVLGSGQPPVKQVDLTRSDYSNIYISILIVFIIGVISFFSWKKIKKSL